MELKEFITNSIKNENYLFFNNFCKNITTSKELFLQVIDNFPEDEAFIKSKKNLITRFFTNNKIKTQNDLDIIQSVKHVYLQCDIKNITGANIHIPNIEHIFSKKQTENDLIKSFAATTNKIAYSDQPAIDEYGESILKKIKENNITIKLNSPSGKLFKDAIFSRTPSNIFSILTHFDELPRYDGSFHQQIINLLTKNTIPVLNDYFKLIAHNKKYVTEPILSNVLVHRTLFRSSSSEQHIYKDEFFTLRIDHLREFYHLNEQEQKPEQSFYQWVEYNIDKNINAVAKNNTDDSFLQKLKIFIEKEKFNIILPNKKTNKPSIKI